MDIIGQCLALVPVPYLHLSWTVFRFIWTTVQDIQASKEQLRSLSLSIAQLLQTLDAEIRAGRLIPEETSAELDNLRSILEDIAAFVRVQSTYNFLKELYKRGDRVAAIEQYHRQIANTVAAFQISGLLNVRDWQSRNDVARAADQQLLFEYLASLERNQKELAVALNAQQSNMVAMMASLQKTILQKLGNETERRFYGQSLRFLSTISGHQVHLEDWMITSFEVDFGLEIGSGGFGRVYKGTWNKTDVALKVLKTDSGMPSVAAIRREVKTWSRLHHPHILQFLGANILDDKPFILMPYLKNGNARDYIQDHPECDRLQILYHISLGLLYLHSNNIVHGDLKALNVLIDDGKRAVLCDFGLSRMKADVTSRSIGPGQSFIAGSRNWMAPERLRGGSPRNSSDVYAFGMTIFEITTLEIPLGHIDYHEFTQLVVNENVRPERPDDSEAPDMFDDLWSLAEQCWVKDPLLRPTTSIICDDIKRFLDFLPAVSRVSPYPLLSPVYIDPSAPSLVSPSPVSPPPVSPSSDSRISRRSTVQSISPSRATVGRRGSYTDDSEHMTDQSAASSDVTRATAGGGRRRPRDSRSLSATPEPVVIQPVPYTPAGRNRRRQSYVEDSRSPPLSREPTVIQMMPPSKGRYRRSQQAYVDGGRSPPANRKSVIIQSDRPESTEEESPSRRRHDSPVVIIQQPGPSSEGTYTAPGRNRRKYVNGRRSPEVYPETGRTPYTRSPRRSYSRSPSPRPARRRSYSASPPRPYYPSYPSYPPVIVPTPPPQAPIIIRSSSPHEESDVFFQFSDKEGTTFKVVIKLWDDRAPRTASSFRDTAGNGKVGPYSFAKYTFEKSQQWLTAETYDSNLFAPFDAELDPNFAPGGFGPSIIALSRPVTRWKALGGQSPNTLAMFLSGATRGDKNRKWLPFGEIIDGLDDLRDLENGGNIRMTDCGIMTDEPSYLSY